jgi:hypothetical protein
MEPTQKSATAEVAVARGLGRQETGHAAAIAPGTVARPGSPRGARASWWSKLVELVNAMAA